MDLEVECVQQVKSLNPLSKTLSNPLSKALSI